MNVVEGDILSYLRYNFHVPVLVHCLVQNMFWDHENFDDSSIVLVGIGISNGLHKQWLF